MISPASIGNRQIIKNQLSIIVQREREQKVYNLLIGLGSLLLSFYSFFGFLRLNNLWGYIGLTLAVIAALWWYKAYPRLLPVDTESIVDTQGYKESLYSFIDMRMVKYDYLIKQETILYTLIFICLSISYYVSHPDINILIFVLSLFVIALLLAVTSVMMLRGEQSRAKKARDIISSLVIHDSTE